MLKTLEAIVDKNGKITLLEDAALLEDQRALVTILDEKPKVDENSQKESLRLIFGKMRSVKMFRDIENLIGWQKNLRDEWE